jgi:Domain of unknown function (DUF4209)
MVSSAVLPTAGDIDAVLNECAIKEDHEFSGFFRRWHEAEPDRGWDLLRALYSLNFRPADAAEPFGPQSVIGHSRSMIPSDLTDEQLSALSSTLDAISDPEYRARILDVLWLRRRDPAAARAAVDAYLLSGSRLEDPEHWVQSMHRYERAVRLASQVEAKGELPKKVLRHLEARVLHYNGSDSLYFTAKALELLADFAYGDLKSAAEIAGRVARVSRSAGNFDRARTYFVVQARLLKAAKDPAAAETARVERAECLSEEAEARQQAGAAIAAHHFLQQAISEFRERPSLRGRLPELQRRLAASGEAALQEMNPISVEIDISGLVKVSQQVVTGLSIENALFTFATLIPLIDPAKLREEALAHISAHPLQALVDAQMFDAAGRHVGTRPGISATDPEQQEAAVVGFMEELARHHRGPYVAGYIVPALRRVVEEHDVEESILDALIGDSPLIHPERKALFLRGLIAGFRWDFATALHLLIPQVEQGLRKMLNDQGVVARNMRPDGIEEVWSYERILGHNITASTLGAPLVYELQSLLVERLGANFRNLVAHGLLPSDAFVSETALYLWWLLLRLIALPSPKMRAFIERRKQ